MLILIFYFTLISFVFIITMGTLLGRKYSWFLSSSSTFMSLVIVLYHFILLLQNTNSIIHINLGTWIKSSHLVINWGFLFDGLSLIMCIIILSIAFLVQIYSYSYLFFDPSLPRFLSYLSLFTFFMLILVTADNLVVLFLGWEGVGLCSYLLISFWNTRVPALKSALKAMLVNRVSDFFLLIGICLIFNEFNSLNFLVVFPMIPYYIDSTFYFCGCWFDLLTTISFFFIIRCFW